MLTRRFKLLYSVGDLSTSAPLAIMAFYQLYFLTDVAGLRPDRAGLAAIIGRIWDSINDPIFGLLSDRIRSRWGRRRVVLLFGALPLGLTFCLQYIVPPWGEWGLVAYYIATFVLFDSTYTAVHVSYNALTPAATRDYDERSSLNGYRMAFSIIGSLISVILATVLGQFIDDPRTLFLVLGVTIGLATAVPLLIAFWVTKPYDDPEEAVGQLPPVAAIKATLSNRPFWLLMGLYLFSWTTASLIGSVFIFYANYYLGVPEQANYFILLAQLSAVSSIPLWVRLAQKYDKRSAFIWGSFGWMIVCLILATLQPEQVVLTYILAVLAGVGIATAYFLPWAMIPDVIELDELRTGQRREGSFYAFAAFFQKMGTGLVIWVFGIALASRGYITPVEGQPLPVQPAEAVQAIRWAMGLVPAILLTCAIIFAWYYPISRESHQAMRDQLAA
ncbi:MAG: MFS transporter [Ardenticatenaceae bacterium]|nr:MFS transporter [Ardenticatenaceae bacterium]